MKVVQQVLEKPKFVPITITLETAGEYFGLLATLHAIRKQDINSSLKLISPNLIIPEYYKSHMVSLHNELYSLVDKVKETL
jgi:hypothetical protein